MKYGPIATALIIGFSILFQPLTGSFAAPVAAEGPDTGRLSAIIEKLESYINKGMADWKVPGLVLAIVHGDDVIYEKAFGVKTLGAGDPVSVDTVFQIGSTSKAFTAALVAMLADERKVRWDDPVVNHLSSFMMNDPWVTRQFTVTDLMAQRSGMPAHAGDSAAILGFDRAHITGAIRFVKPVTSFRSAYAYQNNLFLAAAELIKKKTDLKWEENIRERIFKPLGMTSSSTDLTSFRNGKDVASLHHMIDDKVVVLPMNWKYIDWVYTYAPAGGINSNVKDVAKWIRLQMNDGIFDGKPLISSESMKYMHAPKTVISSGNSVGPRQYYCQGWVYRENNPYPIIWHNGGTSGSKTMIAFVPRAKIGIVVLSNLSDTSLPESLAWRFFDSYFDNPRRDWSEEALEKALKDEEEEKSAIPNKPVKASPALPAERYVGDYANDVYDTITVSRNNGALHITVGPKKTRIALTHFDRDIFTASWDVYIEKEDAGPVVFDIGLDGFAKSVTIQALDEDGCGVFQKVAEK
ncbi:MAG: serine hydrolase [Candidatus Omnitrophica bacterium]|nr:serine hydrolase [Candidatus Omnitrophota bacterium]MBU1809153.1 serine hydrolase [Candidatus Omnitrophota bacterium]